MKYALSQHKIDFYRDNGFVQLDDVLTPAELAQLRQYADEAMKLEDSESQQPDKGNRGYYRVLNQRFNVWRDHQGMAAFSLHPRFAGIASGLLKGHGVRLFHDHLLFKMPGDSKPTPWHQDLPYWPMNETGALSMWLPLDDVTEANGCMMFMPGSHTAGKLDAVDFLNPQDIYQFEQSVALGLNRRNPVMVRMKAGSCTFHDGLTFHYAHANHTDRPRRVLAVIYMPEGTTYSGKTHILCDRDARDIIAGETFAGDMFPKLA